MKDVLVYQPPGDHAQVALFIEGLEPKLREKLLRQIIPLPRMPPSILREPHYKHFTLERYRTFYEVRAKNGIAVRIIFSILPEGKILLLYVSRGEKYPAGPFGKASGIHLWQFQRAY